MRQNAFCAWATTITHSIFSVGRPSKDGSPALQPTPNPHHKDLPPRHLLAVLNSFAIAAGHSSRPGRLWSMNHDHRIHLRLPRPGRQALNSPRPIVMARPVPKSSGLVLQLSQIGRTRFWHRPGNPTRLQNLHRWRWHHRIDRCARITPVRIQQRHIVGTVSPGWRASPIDAQSRPISTAGPDPLRDGRHAHAHVQSGR